MNALPVSVRFGFWMVVSCICFAAMVSLVRHLAEAHGMNVFVISFWRNLLSIVVFLPWLAHARLDALRSKHHIPLFWRALLYFISSTSMFFAVALMPLAEATAISFTTPLFAVILAVIFLHERVGPRRIVGLVFGMIGVLIILRPGVEVFNPVALLPILTALTFGGVLVIGRTLAPIESPEKIAAFIGIYAVPMSAIPAAYYWQWPTLAALPYLLGVGAAAGLNVYALSRGLRIGEASRTAPWDFVRLPFTAFVAYLWFGEVPLAWTWIGAGVIFTSVIFVTWREARSDAREAAREAAARTAAATEAAARGGVKPAAPLPAPTSSQPAGTASPGR